MENTALATTQQTLPAEPDAQPEQTRIDGLRNRLLDHAFLFEDPRGYRAGVEDALEGFQALLASY